MDKQLNTDLEDFNNSYIICKQYSKKIYIYCNTGQYKRVNKFINFKDISYRDAPKFFNKDDASNTVDALNRNRKKCKVHYIKAENYFQETYSFNYDKQITIDKIPKHKVQEKVLNELEESRTYRKQMVESEIIRRKDALKHSIKEFKELKQFQKELNEFDCKKFVEERYKTHKSQHIFDLINSKNT